MANTSLRSAKSGALIDWIKRQRQSSPSPAPKLTVHEALLELAGESLSEHTLGTLSALSGFSQALLLKASSANSERASLEVLCAFGLPEFKPGMLTDPTSGLFGKIKSSSDRVHLKAPMNLLGRQASLAELLLLPVADGDQLYGILAMTGTAQSGELRDIESLKLCVPVLLLLIKQREEQAASARRLLRQQLLSRVARALTESLELEALLQKAADAIHEVLGFPNVDLPLLDTSDGQTLVIKVRGGDYKRRIQGEDRIPISRGIMGAAVRAKRLQLVNDLSRDERYVQPPSGMHMRAELAIPIIWHDSVLGVLNVETQAQLLPDDVELLQIVAHDLASAICNARLFSEVQLLAQQEERARLARSQPASIASWLASLKLQLKHAYANLNVNHDESGKALVRANELLTQLDNDLKNWLKLSGGEGSARSASAEMIKLQGFPVALARLVRAMVPGSIGFSWHADGYSAQSLMLEEAMFRATQQQVARWLEHGQLRSLELSIELDRDACHLLLRAETPRTTLSEELDAINRKLSSVGAEARERLLPASPHQISPSSQRIESLPWIQFEIEAARRDRY